MLPQIAAQVIDAIAFATIGERCRRIDRPTAEIAFPPLANRTKAFKRQTNRVESIVATGTARVVAMPGERLAQGQIAEFAIRPREARERWAEAAESVRPATAARPNSLASPDWFASPARSSSERPTSASNPPRPYRLGIGDLTPLASARDQDIDDP